MAVLTAPLKKTHKKNKVEPVSFHEQSWLNSSGTFRRSERPGLHYWCAVNDKGGWADCVSFHALWMAKQRASVSEPPSLCHNREQDRDRRREPTPLPLSALTASASRKQACYTATLRSHGWRPMPLLLKSMVAQQDPFPQTQKLACETLTLQRTLTGGCSTQTCVWGLLGFLHVGLRWGAEHIIMATHIPTLHSVTLGAKRHH